jgi:hypothetical protein
VLGESAGEALRKIFGPKHVVVYRDPFTEGPCRFDEVVTFGQWVHRRIDWWAGRTGCVEPRERARDVALSRHIDQCGAFDEVVLWAAESVSEQLFACCVAAQFADRAEPPRIFHAGPLEGSLASSPSEKLRSAPIRPVTGRELRAAAAVWKAYVRPTPAEFARRVTRSRPSALFDRLSHLLPRFPAFTDGLTLWERRLLEALRRQPRARLARTLVGVFGRSHPNTDADACDDIGDMILFDMLVDLAHAGLLTMHGDGFTVRATEFRLTRFGRDVLSGRAHRVAGGFHRWIGGTHLSSEAAELWWFVEGGLHLRRIPKRAGPAR